MTLKNTTIKLLHKSAYVRDLYKKNMDFEKNACFPPGHFHSPIISVDDIRRQENEIWRESKTEGINGINLNTQNQIDLVKNHLSKFYGEIPFSAEKKQNVRYHFENEYYSYTDGVILYSMIRNFKPKSIIEIGSGFSSAVMLDTNELFFDNQISLTFIEPHPDRLYSLIDDNDNKSNTIIVSDVQLIPLETFEKLEAGDILFIDSSHVVKTGSDLNYILFEILSRLKSGVLIHFHDIFYPFEYPEEWVLQGRNWNEDYFLKAFLMYNSEFDIILFAHYLHKYHKEVFKDMPLTYKNSGGNLWLKKR